MCNWDDDTPNIWKTMFQSPPTRLCLHLLKLPIYAHFLQDAAAGDLTKHAEVLYARILLRWFYGTTEMVLTSVALVMRPAHLA